MSGPTTVTGRTARSGGRALGGYYVLLVALLYLPIAILFVFSFSANTTISFPLRGFTLEWFERVFADPNLRRAVWNSLQVAVASSFVATALGAAIALLMVRYEFRGKRLLVALAVLPLIAPAVVLAVALLILFRAFDLPLSIVSVGAAHVVVSLPFTTLIIFARLAGFDRSLEDAAMDLGANYATTLRLVVLPIIAPALLAAWLVAFTVSFDEVALALFLAGRDPTFPVYLAGHIRFSGNLPVLVAAAVLLMIGSMALLLVAERVRRLRT
jgi:spermidine/putrescine transport system permease protein